MKTITKTVRIETEMLDMIEAYRKIMKKVFGVETTVNQILSGCIIKGFEDYLKFFVLVKSGAFKEVDGSELSMKIPPEAFELVDNYEGFVATIESEENS